MTAEEPQTALISVEEINPVELFGEGKIDAVIEYIEGQVGDIVVDISTVKGRNELKSAAYKVARSKTLLDDAGKNYAAELKKRVKNIDGYRRTLRESLDSLRDRIRKPVTDWEEAEATRAAEIEDNIQALHKAGQFDGIASQVSEILKETKAVEITDWRFGERKGDAAIAKDIAVSSLERTLKAAEKREQDEAELARLRKQAAKQAASTKAEDERRAAEKAAQEKADAEAAERIAKAEREAQEAREAAEAAKRNAELKIEMDRKAREAEENRKREEAERRAADIEHRRNINTAAAKALVDWANLNEEQAKDVVTVIAANRVPAVTINY